MGRLRRAGLRDVPGRILSLFLSVSLASSHKKNLCFSISLRREREEGSGFHMSNLPPFLSPSLRTEGPCAASPPSHPIAVLLPCNLFMDYNVCKV